MQIMINTRQCPCRTLNDECIINNDDCYEDDVCSFCPLIRNGGIELPRGHGRLIDADAYIDKHEECGWLDDITIDEFNAITPTIIEADKENENETDD